MSDTPTVGGGIRQLVVDSGVVNERIWGDDAPPKATFPYCTFVDGISIATQLTGDGGQMRVFVREVQLDLWERATDEDADVIRALYAAVDHKTIAGVPGVKTRVTVRDVQRLPEPDTQITHHALTLAVRHDPTGL